VAPPAAATFYKKDRNTACPAALRGRLYSYPLCRCADEWLRDSSGKPGEGFVQRLCAGLVADSPITVAIGTAADSPTLFVINKLYFWPHFKEHQHEHGATAV